MIDFVVRPDRVFELHDSIESLPGSTAARNLLVQRSLEYTPRAAIPGAGCQANRIEDWRGAVNSFERASALALSLYTKNRESAEKSVAGARQYGKQFSGEEYEQKELAMFEKQFGYLRATDPKDYEERKRQWMVPVLRQRKEQEARTAAPARGDGQNEQYFDALDTYTAVQQRLAALTPEEGAAPACYVATATPGRSYVMQGQIRRGTGSAACTPLVETNPAYYDRTLPRSAAQLLTLTSVRGARNSAEAAWFRLPGARRRRRGRGSPPRGSHRWRQVRTRATRPGRR